MRKLIIGLFGITFCITAYADTETIKWYVDGNVYTTTTCQSGGNVNIPNEPTKTGYTFQGWLVALYDYSTLDYTIGGSSYTQSAANRTWATTFNYGVVSGVSLCSVTPGGYAVAGTPDETTTGDGTRYCWCKATGYTSDGIVYENTSSSPWVFYADFGSASDCASNCAARCGNFVQNNSAFRRAVFGAAGA